MPKVQGRYDFECVGSCLACVLPLLGLPTVFASIAGFSTAHSRCHVDHAACLMHLIGGNDHDTLNGFRAEHYMIYGSKGQVADAPRTIAAVVGASMVPAICDCACWEYYGRLW